ncbi:hypothetical protein Lal_00027392 [Lupinus albus]|nr:hypothetical protein Lal_00027392 [Lupinus albus]
MKNRKHSSGDSNTNRKSPSSPSSSSSSSSSSPPPPPHPPLPPSDKNDNSGGTSERGGQEVTTIMKTALQVLAELANDDSNNDGGGEGSVGGGTSMALGVGGGVGGSTVVVQEGVGVSGEKGQGPRKKRRSSEVKDSPRGKPSSYLWQKEVKSRKGAFGHMRKHPERRYGTFNKPPSFSTPFSLPTRNQDDGEGTSSTPARGILFDLNEPVTVESGSSNAERNEAPVSPPAAEENKLGFDLNELPDDDDNEDN